MAGATGAGGEEISQWTRSLQVHYLVGMARSGCASRPRHATERNPTVRRLADMVAVFS